MKDEQLDLFEEEYCQTRATHGTWTFRECYNHASLATNYREDVTESAVKKRITRLEHDPRITRRIDEIRTDIRRRKGAEWAERKDVVGELMYKGVVSSPQTQKNGIHDAVKTIGMLADFYGWREADRIELTSTGVDTTAVNGKIDALMKKLGVTTTEERKEGADDTTREA